MIYPNPHAPRETSQPPLAPAYNLKLPFAAFVLIAVCGAVFAVIVVLSGNQAIAPFVFGGAVVVGVAVALGIILSDRSDFRYMNRKEQSHNHEMQRMATETERIRIQTEIQVRLMGQPQMQTPALQIKSPMKALGWGAATPEPEPEPVKDDLVDIWIVDGNSHKLIHYSMSLLNDFIRMSEPTRQNWNHGSDSYGPTARVIAGIDDTPLLAEGNGWKWGKPHREVIHWWRDLLEAAR